MFRLVEILFGSLSFLSVNSDSHVVIAVIHKDHLALKITNILFEALSRIHLDREKVINVLLKLLSGSILVIESMLHLFEVLE